MILMKSEDTSSPPNTQPFRLFAQQERVREVWVPLLAALLLRVASEHYEASRAFLRAGVLCITARCMGREAGGALAAHNSTERRT